MICIYEANETDWHGNGLCILQPSSCTVSLFYAIAAELSRYPIVWSHEKREAEQQNFLPEKAPVHFRQMLSHDIASFPYLIISFKGKYFSVRESLCSVITRILSIAFAPEFSRFHEFPQRAFD